MNPATGHLTDAQIENYVQDANANGPDARRLPVEAHVADCDSCRNRVLDAQRNRLGLLEGDCMRETPYPGCPAEETLQDLAAGIGPSESVEATTEHAAHCDFCGPLLARYMREFSETLEEEESDLLAQLKSSKPRWQKNFVRKYVAPPDPKPVWSFWPKLATAAVAIVAIAFGLYIGFYRDDLTQAQKLVASAYSERRTIEMRLTGVGFSEYRPLPTEMGPESRQGLDYQRPDLLDAKSKLAAKLHSGVKVDPQWLQLEGRIGLLDDPNSAEEAEKDFKKAEAQGLTDPNLKIDLAAAYFERDTRMDSSNQPGTQIPNLARTIDLLSMVLKSPNLTKEQELVAHYDLAIAYEKSAMWDLALSEWQQYLTLDRNSSWAKEAQAHLDNIKKKVPPPKAQGYKQPSYLMRHASDPGVQNDIEQYQDIAIASWLPKAVEDPSSESGLAVDQIAGLMQRDHFDNWWADFLKAARSADLPAVRALSAASVDAENDLHYQAIRESRQAAAIFAKHNNLPGELFARFEEVYALQRILSADDCLSRANSLGNRLSNTKYHWLQAQVALERATCANLMSDYKTSDLSLDTSQAFATQFHFPELLLRITGISASIERMRGKYDEAWRKGVEGLRSYWEGSYSLARLYQFYAVMRQCAKDARLFYAAEDLLRHSISLLENDAPEDLGMRAVLYLRLANLLEQFQDPAAEAEAGKAKELLNRIPVNEGAVQTYPAVTRVELADFELRRREPQLALSIIEPAKTILSRRDDFLALDFYDVLGRTRLQLNQPDDAIQAFRDGIRLAERSFTNLEDDSSRSHWIRITDEIYRGLVEALLAKQDDVAALVTWEQLKMRSLGSPGNNSFTASAAFPSSGAFLPSVSEPHLVYASFDDHLQLWTITGSQIQGKAIAVKRSDLERLARGFAELCATPDSSLAEINKKGQELYGLLLRPAAGQLSAFSAVTIELDQPLAALPIEALESEKGRYFGDDYIVSYSPGLLAAEQLRRPEELKADDHFLVVDAAPSSGSRYLPGHELATDAINQSHFRTTIMARANTSPASVKAQLSTSVGFHFTGHGRRDGTGTALELGPTAFLKARDFSPQFSRRLQLAVLAACSSGSTENGLLDSDNLVRALLVAGVPRIIASHWNVDSRSTGELMKRFYFHLASEPAAAALRDACREMRQDKPAPYYWAGFRLVGRAH